MAASMWAGYFAAYVRTPTTAAGAAGAGAGTGHATSAPDPSCADATTTTTARPVARVGVGDGDGAVITSSSPPPRPRVSGLALVPAPLLTGDGDRGVVLKLAQTNELAYEEPLPVKVRSSTNNPASGPIHELKTALHSTQTASRPEPADQINQSINNCATNSSTARTTYHQESHFDPTSGQTHTSRHATGRGLQSMAGPAIPFGASEPSPGMYASPAASPSMRSSHGISRSLDLLISDLDALRTADATAKAVGRNSRSGTEGPGAQLEERRRKSRKLMGSLDALMTELQPVEPGHHQHVGPGASHAQRVVGQRASGRPSHPPRPRLTTNLDNAMSDLLTLTPARYAASPVSALSLQTGACFNRGSPASDDSTSPSVFSPSSNISSSSTTTMTSPAEGYKSSRHNQTARSGMTAQEQHSDLVQRQKEHAETEQRKIEEQRKKFQDDMQRWKQQEGEMRQFVKGVAKAREAGTDKIGTQGQVRGTASRTYQSLDDDRIAMEEAERLTKEMLQHQKKDMRAASPPYELDGTATSSEPASPEKETDIEIRFRMQSLFHHDESKNTPAKEKTAKMRAAMNMDDSESEYEDDIVPEDEEARKQVESLRNIFGPNEAQARKPVKPLSSIFDIDPVEKVALPVTFEVAQEIKFPRLPFDFTLDLEAPASVVGQVTDQTKLTPAQHAAARQYFAEKAAEERLEYERRQIRAHQALAERFAQEQLDKVEEEKRKVIEEEKMVIVRQQEKRHAELRRQAEIRKAAQEARWAAEKQARDAEEAEAARRQQADAEARKAAAREAALKEIMLQEQKAKEYENLRARFGVEEDPNKQPWDADAELARQEAAQRRIQEKRQEELRKADEKKAAEIRKAEEKIRLAFEAMAKERSQAEAAANKLVATAHEHDSDEWSNLNRSSGNGPNSKTPSRAISSATKVKTKAASGSTSTSSSRRLLTPEVKTKAKDSTQSKEPSSLARLKDAGLSKTKETTPKESSVPTKKKESSGALRLKELIPQAKPFKRGHKRTETEPIVWTMESATMGHTLTGAAHQLNRAVTDPRYLTGAGGLPTRPRIGLPSGPRSTRA